MEKKANSPRKKVKGRSFTERRALNRSTKNKEEEKKDHHKRRVREKKQGKN